MAVTEAVWIHGEQKQTLLYPRMEYICPSAAAEDRANKQEYETAETKVSSRIFPLLDQNIARKLHVSTTAFEM